MYVSLLIKKGINNGKSTGKAMEKGSQDYWIIVPYQKSV